MKKTIIIEINWNNKESIKKSERQKASAENKGYSLIASLGGCEKNTLIYEIR